LKRFLSISLVVLALVAAVSATQFSANGFRANFPDTVETKGTTLHTTDVGNVEIRQYSTSTSAGWYAVFFAEYTPAQVAGWNGDTSAQLQSAMQGGVAAMRNHLIKQKAITLQGWPGLEFEAETEDGTIHVVDRIFMVNTIMYQIMVVYPLNLAPSDTTTFLDSLTILER